jgi:hypothetical protein
MELRAPMRGISGALMFSGGLIFFFGDRALREIWKVNFFVAELCGIGGGILLMLVGGAIGSAVKRDASRIETDTTANPD